MPRSRWTSDSASESDGSQKDPFAVPPTTKFNVPSPVTLSDAEEDASPSQYRKEMVRKQARRQSDDEDEEEEDGEEEEMEEQEEEEILVKRNRPKMDDMYSEFMNMARKFTSLVEDTRKQELMSRKTARQSLEFDSPPRQHAKCRLPQFTPPRHAREQIEATQDDDDDDIERDSLCSSQTGSTRIRLQERWRIIGTKDKATTTVHEIDQWIQEHGRAEMAKAGQFEDLRPASTNLGGFKRVHVSHCNTLNMDDFCELNWFVCLQGYKSTSERATKLCSRVQYNCPYRWRCQCYVALSVKEYNDKYVLLQAGEHTMSSHVESSGILNPKQRGAVERAARSAPLSLGSQIHASMQNFSPGRHIPYDRRSRKAVDRLVRKTRQDVMSRRVGRRLRRRLR
jgi:hypothetical protein